MQKELTELKYFTKIPIEFKRIYTLDSKPINLYVIRRTPLTQLSWDIFFNEKNKFIGFTSYKNFPFGQTEIINKSLAWCHCLKNTENILPKNVPQLLISESDFVASYIKPSFPVKEFDLCYICQKGQHEAKNLNFFLQKLSLLCDKLNLKVALVGMNTEDLGVEHNNLFCFGSLSRNKTHKIIGKSRFLFLPNELDASPKILTESLLLNVPVLVNKNIIGGWKYISKETGSFFDTEGNLEDSIRFMLKNKFKSREYFLTNFNLSQSQRKLAKLVNSLGVEIKKYDFLTFKF